MEKGSRKIGGSADSLKRGLRLDNGIAESPEFKAAGQLYSEVLTSRLGVAPKNAEATVRSVANSIRAAKSPDIAKSILGGFAETVGHIITVVPPNKKA